MSTGHPYCLQYGYSFFKTALTALEKFQKQQILSMAMAIRLSLAKDQDFNKFIGSI